MWKAPHKQIIKEKASEPCIQYTVGKIVALYNLKKNKNEKNTLKAFNRKSVYGISNTMSSHKQIF
jgi:hypothetical protein